MKASHWMFPPIAAFAFCVAGCLSRPALSHQSFALQNPPANSAAAKGQGTLMLEPIEVSPAFASRELVYRTGVDSYEVDPYAGFLVTPGQALENPVRSWLRNSGAFKDVVEPGSLLKADKMLQAKVTELYGDFRNSSQPTAVLSLQMTFSDRAGNGPEKVFLHKDYTRTVPLKQRTAAALVAGYDQALSEIMSEVASDLGSAR